MGTILPFSPKPPAKIGFQKVRKRRKKRSDQQMDLFSERLGRVLHLPGSMSPFDMALLLDERGDSRAAKVYQDAITHGDSIADAYCNLGILESKAGRTTKAFDCFTRSLKDDPRHLESHYNLGNLYFEAGDLKLAKTHFEMATEIDPDFPNAHFNLGLVHALNEDFSASVDAFQRFIEIVPEEEGSRAKELLDNLRLTLKSRR